MDTIAPAKNKNLDLICTNGCLELCFYQNKQRPEVATSLSSSIQFLCMFHISTLWLPTQNSVGPFRFWYRLIKYVNHNSMDTAIIVWRCPLNYDNM